MGYERLERGIMRIERHYTEADKSPYDAIEFRKATSEIRNPDGSIVFRLEDIDVPASWSQVAISSRRNIFARPAFPPG